MGGHEDISAGLYMLRYDDLVEGGYLKSDLKL